MSTTPRHGTVAFYFDIQCPFAYLASERISDLARFQGADIVWTPVLLGGLYDLTAAEQGKGGSASDVMPPAKKAMVSSDFAREISRYKVPLKFHPNHPLRTVDAGRLLCAFPPQYHTQLAQALFRAYWVSFTLRGISRGRCAEGGRRRTGGGTGRTDCCRSRTTTSARELRSCASLAPSN